MPRKREREVSLEPQTPQQSGNVRQVLSDFLSLYPCSVLSNTINILALFLHSQELESPIHDAKDHRAPARKNRISAQLDVTQEEEEQDGEIGALPANEQGMSSSPPTETKIRQISQGVEDITWQNQPKPATPTPEDEQTEPNAEQHAPMDAEESTVDAVKPVVPSLMQGENPPLVIDNAGEDEHAGGADPAEPPPEAQPTENDIATQQHEETTPPPDTAVPFPKKDEGHLSRQGSDENVEVEKKSKRKLDDRTMSESKVPEELIDLKSGKPSIAAKRPRDDDTDDNPRETKRPTPPPDEETQVEEPSTSRSQTPPPSVISTQATTQSVFSTPKTVGSLSVSVHSSLI